MNRNNARSRRFPADINRLKAIELLLLDVDGVLTDGRIVYSDSGSETKAFNVKDGFGLRMLMESGVKVGIVTGRRSGALAHRCRDLAIDMIYEGVTDKATMMDAICRQTGITPEAVAFVGDDLPDIPIMNKSGVAIAVADAHERVREISDMVTVANGGGGAVREVCEAILKARGLWDSICSVSDHGDPEQ